jgi:hypothetical protein
MLVPCWHFLERIACRCYLERQKIILSISTWRHTTKNKVNVCFSSCHLLERRLFQLLPCIYGNKCVCSAVIGENLVLPGYGKNHQFHTLPRSATSLTKYYTIYHAVRPASLSLFLRIHVHVHRQF